jgi:site-specific recombinase XerD
LGRVKACDVTSQQISAYIEQRQREKAAAASINRELEMLRRAFRLAMDATPPLLHSAACSTKPVRTAFVLSSDAILAWNTARKAAGLPDVLVHDLRRTAVRNMMRAGISHKVAMLIGGHRTMSVFQRYDTDERDILEAGEELAECLKKQSSHIYESLKVCK